MIIECKCKKYKFKIPESEILNEGRYVKCEICSEEWPFNFDLKKSKNDSLEILENINPSKASFNLKVKNKKKDTGSLLYTLIIFIIIFIIYKILMVFRFEVLQRFPDLKNFYESLELVTEIIKSYIVFFKELLSEKFINL